MRACASCSMRSREKRCAFVGQRLKEDAAVHLYIAVGQVEGDTGEAEAVFLLRAVHTADHRHIAVGYEIEALDFRGPGIVVFSHQQALAFLPVPPRSRGCASGCRG